MRQKQINRDENILAIMNALGVQTGARAGTSAVNSRAVNNRKSVLYRNKINYYRK